MVTQRGLEPQAHCLKGKWLLVLQAAKNLNKILGKQCRTIIGLFFNAHVFTHKIFDLFELQGVCRFCVWVQLPHLLHNLFPKRCPADKTAGHGARVSCVTAAEKGSWAYDGYRLFHADTILVQILDTTGAGDNFHGAFLYCINHGWGLEFALRFSNIFASLTCRELGGRAAIPSRETVLALYRSENSHSCSPASR